MVTIICGDPMVEKLLHYITAELTESEQDVILLDAAWMKRMGEFPGSKVILFTASADPAYLPAARESGAAGFWYLNPSLEGLSRVLAGDPAFPEKSPWVQLGKVSGHDLTPRELDVLRQLTLGRSDGDIAAALCCSVSTVKHYVSSLREKTGITSRIELAVRAKSTGLIDLSQENICKL